MKFTHLVLVLLVFALACNEKATTPTSASTSAATPTKETPKPQPAAPAPAPAPAPQPAAAAPEPAPAAPAAPTVKIRTKVNGVELVARADWGATEPNAQVLDAMEHPQNTPITYVVVMHSGFPATAENELKVIKNIQFTHMNSRKWGDISAHYIIGPSGKVYEGRSLQYRADGTVGDGMGANSFLWGKCAIMFLGDFSSEEPTEAAKEALVNLVVDRSKVFNKLFREALVLQEQEVQGKLGRKDESLGLNQVRIRLHSTLGAKARDWLKGEQGGLASIRSMLEAA